MRSQVEAGSNDAANPLGSSRRARTSLLLTLVAALAFAAIALSSVAAADQIPVSRFGTTGSGDAQLRTPGGIAVDPSTGDIYVADTGNNRVDKFSASGEFLRAWGWGVKDDSSELQTCTTSCEIGIPGKGAGQLNGVVGVAVDPTSGDVYTVNRRDGRVQRFTANGAFVEAFGGYGSGAGEFGSQLPSRGDIAVDAGGQVLVTDPAKNRVAVFDSNGVFASEIATGGYTVAIGPGGLVYVGSEGETVGVYEFEASPAPGAWTLKREVSLQESYGPVALAVSPVSGNLIAEVTAGYGASTTYALKEFDSTGKLVATTRLPEMVPPGSEYPPVLSFGLATSAAHFPEFEAGAVYVVNQPANEVIIRAEGEPQEPRIEGVRPTNVSTGFADLSAQLNPKGAATEYAFEYGPTAAYGASAPATPGHLAAGFEATTVGAHLTGLAPGTTYHFRLVARNALGTVQSADQTFATYPTGSAASLPDGRAYEMVTPVEKGQNDVESRGSLEERGVAGGDEAGLAYSTMNGLPGSAAGPLLVANAAKRGATGWTTSFISPPEINQTTLATGVPVMLSADLNKALVTSKVDLTGNAPPGYNAYIHTLSPSSYQLVTPEGAGSFGLGAESAVGAANDFSRVYFQSTTSLTPDSPTTLFRPNLYEWSAAGLRNVGLLPGRTTPAAEGVIAYQPRLRPVSEDGTAVVFGAEDGGPAQVFRRAGGETVEVSAPNPGVTDPAGPQMATFVGAAANGSSVFFLSPGKLTADADTGESAGGGTDLAPNLYRYDVASGELTDLTVETGGYERGAAVTNAVVAADGSAAYFVAEGELAAGATGGATNLFRWSQGGGIQFIATVSPADPIASPYFAPEADVDPTGSAIAFVSRAGLAGHPAASGIQEIYHWSAGEGLACASCGSGVIQAGASMPAPALQLGSGAGHPLSADGTKVFFTTSDALVAGDTNGKQDAYEWEGGADRLLSTGTGNSNSYFIDASPSGKDVFFATRDRLVGADVDDNIDIYDAREGGGFAEAPAAGPPCEAEACRPPLTAAPPGPQLGSRGYRGPGDKKPNRHHKKKTKKQKHKSVKCKGGSKKQCSKQKSHKAHSGGKRG